MIRVRSVNVQRAILVSVILMFSLDLQRNPFISHSSSESDDLEEGVFSTQPTPFINGISYLDHDMLSLVLGGDVFMNFDNFTSLIENYFIPANVRMVGLSVGWEEHANTSRSDITFYKWVNDFLMAADSYDVDVFFIFDPWKKLDGGSSWWDDLVEDKPELKSLFKNYTLHSVNELALLISDSPLILEQLEEDLKQLYDYYGKHASWKGILIARPDGFTTFVPVDNFANNIVYNNYTLNKFLNSIFYLGDVSTEGVHKDGTICKIWQQFRSNGPLLIFASGYAQRSYPEDVRSGVNSKIVAVVFKATKSIEEFKISWYGRRVGEPGRLRLELYDLDANNMSLIAKPLDMVEIRSELVGTRVGWQPFVKFSSKLSEGVTYSIVFRAEGEVESVESDKYEIYYRNYKVDDSAFLSSSGAGDRLNWQFKGSAIIWIKDSSDNDFLICPFQDRGIIRNDKSDVRQVFRSPGNITFNTLFLSVSDRPYDENLANVKIIKNSDGRVVAKGSIRPRYTKGMYWWLPVPLESEASLEEGEEYTLTVERMNAGEGWQLHYLITDPAVAGPQGKDRMLLFRLAYMDPIFINFMKIGPPGRAGPEAGWPGAEYKTWWAQRYSISRNASLLSVEVNIEKYGNPGDLIVRLREDDGTGLAPSTEDIEAIRVPAANISEGRVWLNITGWSTTLSAKKMYWIILSTDESPEGSGYWPWKIEYAYQFLIKRSDDAGKTWVRPHEPAELYINLFTSEEMFLVEPEAIIGQTFVTDKKQIAQSFILEDDAYVRGLLVFISRNHMDEDGLLVAEIRTDNGFDSPSTMILTSGKMRMINGGITFKGMQIVEFDYPYFLRASTKYWVVIKGDESSRVEPILFAFHYPEFSYGGTQLKVKMTSDGGESWYIPEGRESDLLFGLIRAPYELYGFTAQELADDIERYHIHELSEEPIRGLDAYLGFQMSESQKRLVQWFKSYTGRNWLLITSNHPRLIEEVQGLQELVYVFKADNISRADRITAEFSKVIVVPELNLSEETLRTAERYYDMILPNYPKKLTLLDLKNIRTLETVVGTNISKFWNILRLMAYPGGERYGRNEGTVRVLLIGEKESLTLVRYLLSTFNVTLARVEGDQNLSKFNEFKSFDVILLASDGHSTKMLTPNAYKRLRDFVLSGGGLVVMFRWAEYIKDIVGFRILDEKIPAGSLYEADLKNPILSPNIVIDRYTCNWSDNKIVQVSQNATFIVKDTNGQPWISSNSYGSGRGVLCGAPSGDLSMLKYDYLQMLTNAIFYAAKREQELPVLWYGDSLKEISLNDGPVYSIAGKPGGPILLWLINDDLGTKFEIHLNASFFNIDSEGWVAFDATNLLPIYRGNGSEISIGLLKRLGGWSPIYIVNDTRDFHLLYSNAQVLAQKIYPNQALYDISAPRQQTIWLIVRSATAPKETSVNGIAMKKVNALPLVVNDTNEEAYFYDLGNGLLYIKVKSQIGENVIRVSFEKTATRFFDLANYKQFTYVALVLLFILIEIYVIRRNRKNAGL